VPAHGLAPQNLSSDKHVDVCVDSDEDRGSTPLASSLRSQRSGERRLSRRSLGEGGPPWGCSIFCCELRLGKPAEKCAASPTFTFSKANVIQGVFTQDAQAICASDRFATMRAESRIQQSGSRGRSRLTSPFPMLNAQLSLNAISSLLQAALFSKSDFKISHSLRPNGPAHRPSDLSHSLQSWGRPFGLARE
jgi:hypothetical protein